MPHDIQQIERKRKTMKVLNFGSLNLDYVYNVDHMVAAGETQNSLAMNTFCGGKGLNQSIALARAGARVYHAGLIGEEGAALYDALKEANVHTDFVKTIEGKSGHTIIQVDKNGQNCILLYGGANRCMCREYIDQVLEAFSQGDILLLQNEINLLDYLIDCAYDKGMRIVLNPSPYDENLDCCDLGKVSLFLINEIEGEQITGERKPEHILQKMKEAYPDAGVVLTLGGDGAVYQDDACLCRQPIYAVEAVDTTAAGDTFTGYFLTALIEGKSVEEGLDLAAKASAIAVTRKGAAPSIPLRSEVLSGGLTPKQ